MADQVNLEDEMSRFEQEILGSGTTQQRQPAPSTAGPSSSGPSTAASVVIGASTFTSVQEQLSSLRAQVYGNKGPSNNVSSPPSAASQPPGQGAEQRQMMAPLGAPPRPPGFRPSFSNDVNITNGGVRPKIGPPPPPPSFLGGPPRPASFVPSQLRARVPQSGPPQRPPMQGPPQRPSMQGPPQRPPMQGPPQRPPMQGPPQRPPMQGPPQRSPMQGPPQGPPMQGPPQRPPMQGPPGRDFQGPPRPPMQGPPMPPMMTRPMQGPPMMPPAMRAPPGMMPGMHNQMAPIGPQGPHHTSLSGNPVRYTSQPATVVAAPRVVYSSKPVINKPSKKAAAITSDSQSQPASKKREAPEPTPSTSGTSQAGAPATQSASNSSANDSYQPVAKKEKKNKPIKDKRCIRTAANEVWEDHSLAEWDPNDFRVFCGDLGNEVTDEKLAEAFKKYPSLQKAKVVRDRRTHKTKGYGFISFKDPTDYTRAMREMNGKYVGNRPIKLRKSNWRDRNVDVVKKKDKEKKRLGFR